MLRLAVYRFISEGQAFIPVNAIGKGDVVQLIYMDGSTQLVDVQAETFLKHVLAYFGAELKPLRKRYGSAIGKKQLVPLPLSRNWTLIPFITREAIGRQSRTGWFVFSMIRRFQEIAPQETKLYLQDYSITILHSARFTRKQMLNAKLVEAEYERIHRSIECKESLNPYSSLSPHLTDY